MTAKSWSRLFCLKEHFNQYNSDFKIQRCRRQQERQKTIGFISKTTTLHEHHACLYISLPVFARLRPENA